MVVRACLQGCPPRSTAGPRAPSPGRRPQLEAILSGPPGQGPPPPRCWGGGGTPGGTSRPKPLRRPAAEGVPLRARRSAHRANWRVPQIILSGPPRQGPPPRCRGRRGMARSTPRRKPPRAPAPEGAPPDLAHRPQLEVLLSGPPWQGAPPPLDAGAKGACLQLSPVESPPAPRPGKACPFDPPSWPTSSPPAKPSSELASTHNPQNAHCPPGKTPGATSPAPCPLQGAVCRSPWSLSQLASRLAAQIRARGPPSGSPLQAPGAAGTIDGEV